MEEQKKSWIVTLMGNIKLEIFVAVMLTFYACYLYRQDELNLISVIILGIIWAVPIISILMGRSRKKRNTGR